MENSENKEEKIKKWLNNKYNLIFLAILILALFIGLYYFNLTKSQPLWWDEADYMAYAKNLAGANVDWIVTEKHNSLFPYMVAGLFMIGLSEIPIKFILEFIPYILLVLMTYLTASEMYNKKTGLIASFLMATTWAILFNTMRFHLGIPAMFFGILAIYIFWKGYEKKQKIFGKISPHWAIPLTIISLLLAYSIRRSYILFGLFFAVYFILTVDWKSAVKNKYNWIGLIILLALFFTLESTIFSSGIANVSSGFIHPENQWSLAHLDSFKLYFSNIDSPLFSVLLYLFYIGFVIILFNIFLSLGYIKKSKSQTKADLFVLVSIIVTLLFFISTGITLEVGEPRWYFPLLFSSLICISRSTEKIADFVSNNNKQLGILVLVLLIGFGGYYEVVHANSIITSKVNSFKGIREAGLFLKENSNQEDLILTLGQPQVEYYSERRTVHAREFVDADHKTQAHFDKSLEELQSNPNIKYILISFSEPGYPDWMRIQTPTSWEIPFMESKIDFANQIQDIKEEKIYDNLKFTLVNIKEDVFIYSIERI
jgi:4-amino-4-deoxy-L-arabinose transferase-like glycosyltransferase